MTSSKTRFLLPVLPFLLAAGLSACSSSPPPPPPVFTPLNYSYLPPIMLNIASISIQNNYVPDPGAANLIGIDPAPPADTLSAMLQHRLQPNGTPGTGIITIENASLEPAGATIIGTMAIRVQVVSADGRKNGFTEASVTVTHSVPDPDDGPDGMKSVLYTITKQLMDAMNVQLQYQLQRNMGSWISYGMNAAAPALNSTAPGGIQSTPLTQPGAPMPGAPMPGAPMPGAPASSAPPPVAPATAIPAPAAPAGANPVNATIPLPTQSNGLPLSSQSLGTLPVTQ